MSENTENRKEYYIAKNTGYYENIDDYLVPENITVTITLREYRNLVKLSGTHEYLLKKEKDDCAAKLQAKDEEIRNLQAKIDTLLSAINKASGEEE